MSRPAAGRNHLWVWAVAAVMIYAASCPPVEAWYEKQAASAVSKRHSLPVTPGVVNTVASGESSSSSRPERQAGNSGAQDLLPAEMAAGGFDVFEVAEVEFVEVPEKPVWMQYFYAPVHWLAGMAPFDELYRGYRAWCEQWIGWS